MPWHLEKRDDEFCVIKDSDDSVEKCHPTEDEAKKHMAALYSAERALPVGGEFVVRALPELEVKESEGDGSLATILGYATLFNQWAPIDSAKEGRFIERVAPGAFQNAIEADKERTRLLFEHGTHPQQGRLPLGPIEDISEDERGARYRGRLLDTEFNRELLPGLKAKLYGSSFLGKPHYSDANYTAARSAHNPEGWPELTMVKVRPLLDVGPTPFPAYLGTVTTARSLTDEFLFRHFESGEGLQKFAEWAKEQADPKIQMPVKEPASRSTAVQEPPVKPPQDTPVTQRKEPEMAADIDRYTSKETLAGRRDEIKSKVQLMTQEYTGRAFPTEVDNEWNELNEEFDAITARLDVLDKREARAARVMGDGPTPPSGGAEPAVPEEFVQRTINAPKSRIPDNVYDVAAYRTVARSLEDSDALMVDGARRAIEIEEYQNPVLTREQAQTNIERLMREAQGNSDDLTSPKVLIARHILATGSEVYRRAAGKYMRDQNTAGLTAEENHALFAARALSLTGASGGFAVPFELDPTILGTSNGTINFVRAISRVVNITVDEWRGITSAGITAGYGAEATEATDNAPTLVQPTVSTEKAQAFVPFSIEIGMDWDSLQAEMARALQDAKDELEAAKFISGTGTNDPFGALTGTTNTVAAAAGQTFTLANLYALQNALPPRYRARGAFMGALAVINRIRQFDTAGGAALLVQLGEGTPERLLGKPLYEASDMADVATSVKFMLFGDFSRYLIAERVGLSIDLIPHLFGTNHRPTGQRGIYAFWRNGAKVLDANAFRALLGTA